MRRGASHVTVAVSLSRVAGLVRERFFAHYLGTSDAADAFGAAFRIPTLMESVLGERVFSSAFIPRYSRLLAEGAQEEARRLAWVVGSIHALIVTALVVAGVLSAPLLVGWIAPGFDAAKADLTVRLVRLLFPAVGLLVVGAWCLGVLNSHRRFFLPYAVPILSAVSITVALALAGRTGRANQVAVAAAWGALVGAALQVAVQLPAVLALVGAPRAGVEDPQHLREVARNAGPATVRGLIGRLGTWVEVAIAGFVSTGALALLNYSQLLYSLPVGLFTVAISAALLPELSAATADQATVAERLRGPLDSALRHTAFLLVACAVAFITLGDVIAAAVYQGGQFTSEDARFVWAILGASSVGLVGASMGGLHATAFYALGDAMTPLKASVWRLALRGVVGAVLAVPVVRWLGIDARWGAAGLGAALGVSGWVEFLLLRRWLDRRLGWTRPPGFVALLLKLWGIAALAAAAAWGVKLAVAPVGPILRAAVVLGTYGVIYLGVTTWAGVREAHTVWNQLRAWARL
ncbi:MAG: murein biosynthesis integral membrane protein MurJ [Gemmatimonadota bacterium]